MACRFYAGQARGSTFQARLETIALADNDLGKGMRMT